MKRLVVVTGVALALLSALSSAGADPRDSVDRGDRLDRDAIRNDVRIDRLKVPRHPLDFKQPAQAAPFGDDTAKKKRAPRRGREYINGANRKRTPGASNRQMQSHQEQGKSR